MIIVALISSSILLQPSFFSVIVLPGGFRAFAFRTRSKSTSSDLTFDALKEKAVDLVSAFPRSCSIRPWSSVKAKYWPVVRCRRRKAWPHLMLLPLQLHRGNRQEIHLHENKSFSIFILCLLTHGRRLIIFWVSSPKGQSSSLLVCSRISCLLTTQHGTLL